MLFLNSDLTPLLQVSTLVPGTTEAVLTSVSSRETEPHAAPVLFIWSFCRMNSPVEVEPLTSDPALLVTALHLIVNYEDRLT